MNRDQLPSSIQQFGLTSVSEQIQAVARECIVFHPIETIGDARLGGTRVGGLPDLAKNVEWPQRDGRPLAFLAQISLSEIPLLGNANRLPRTGILYFFYDVIEQPWGFDPRDSGSCRVIYLPQRDEICRREFPDKLPEDATFNAVQIAPKVHVSLPSWEHAEAHALNLTDPQVEAYDKMVAEIRRRYPTAGHQMFGWPQEIQGAMELECQLVTNGLYCGDSTGYNDPRASELAPGADDWLLLLQLDSDDKAGMMWGDVGRLYFWIREQELNELSFDSTWVILQCY